MVTGGGRTRHPAAAARRGEEGYNLVLLMVIVTVLNVLLAAALPAWTAMDQRQKEEELIFRGLQYAEAIRVFQARFGRLPVRLEELIEVEPRSIRQLWSDPLTGSDTWGLIFVTAAATGQQPGQVALPRSVLGDADQPEEVVTQGPITGVYSLAEGEGIKSFLGSHSYADWRFTVDLLVGQQTAQQAPPVGTGPDGRPQQPQQPQRPQQPQQPQQPQLGQIPGAAALLQAGVAPDLSMRWIGRPWPRELETQMQAPPQAGGGIPGAQGGLPGQGLTPGQGSGQDLGFGGGDDGGDDGRDGDGRQR